MRDLFNNVAPKQCIAPAAATTDNTVFTGSIIDRAGFESLTYVINVGALADADATFAVTLEEGDQANLSDAAVAASGSLIGTAALASFTFADDNKCFKLGYKGSKRYTRLKVTPSNNTGNAFVSAVALLGHPASAPTANPPA